jgi:hypothetical protein
VLEIPVISQRVRVLDKSGRDRTRCRPVWSTSPNIPTLKLFALDIDELLATRSPVWVATPHAAVHARRPAEPLRVCAGHLPRDLHLRSGFT